MKRLMLATVAAGMLACPALAMDQQSGTNDTSLKQESTNAEPQNIDRHADVTADRRTLSSDEITKDVIERVQQALNTNGFDAGRVDGVWGPSTIAALKNFQERNKLVADGKLDDKTVAALGLTQQEPSTTGSAVSAPEGTDREPGDKVKNPSNDTKVDD